MFIKIYSALLLAILIAVPAFCQVEPSATGGGEATEDDSQMMTPPPVSGLPYPNTAASEERSNYLEAGISGGIAYNDNVLPGINSPPISATTFLITPSIAFLRSSSRQSIIARYSPNFTLYEPASVSNLNTVNESASLIYQNRPSPHVTFSLQDYFLRTNDVFTESYPFSTGGLTGSSQAPVPALIAPYAEQQSDTASGNIGYQFSRSGMIGGGGSYANYDYPNPSQAANLTYSSSESGDVFYSTRLAQAQYAGLSYNYTRTAGNTPYPQFEAQIHTVAPFYTIYFTRRFSLSVSAGVQRVAASQAAAQSTATSTTASTTASTATSGATWTPSAVASMGWQGNRGSFAVSYLHAITTGQGLYGAYHSDSGYAAGSFQLTRTWNAGLGVSYADLSNATSLPTLVTIGGTTLAAQATLTHTFSERLSTQFGYSRLQEHYPGILVITENPDSDRGFVTVTYDFRKPLGR